LCVSRCGARAEVADGAFRALLPDPAHPTGRAICLKGKAAPEIVYHPSRLLHPLRRTRPKDAPDPGWERITWDEALDTVAERLKTAAAAGGPESVAFGSSSPSTSAISDAVDWIQRLIRAFGSPNYCSYMELCGWGRYLAPLYTFGASVPGVYVPDLDNAGCILFWGYNPSVARLVHATSTVAALARGAKLIVVDPRKAGLAAKADHWLRVRPGTDAALALSLTHVMIENGWYDSDFVRDWTNAADEVGGARVWDMLAARCAEFPPDVAERITGVPAADIVAAARTLWTARPVAFYTWSGLEQHSSATQTIRAINILYALTGSLDVPGGNVLFESVPSHPVDGKEFLSGARPPAVGADRRPLGPARYEFITGEALYTAALDGPSMRSASRPTGSTSPASRSS
jgi:anaerobic selenocysteine-containing dehydrogenase